MAENSSDNERRDKTKRKLLECLAESGNISYSCKRAGISRETFYQWKKDSLFEYDADIAMEYGKSFVNDLAHTQLIRNIQDGNMQAVRFQLASCHPDYQPKRPRVPEADKSMPVTTINISAAPPRVEDEDAPPEEPEDPDVPTEELGPITKIHIFAAPKRPPGGLAE